MTGPVGTRICAIRHWSATGFLGILTSGDTSPVCRAQSSLSLLASLLVTGCILGGQTGTEEARPGNGLGTTEGGDDGGLCAARSVVPLDRDQVSPLGFSPAEVLAYAVGSTEMDALFSSEELPLAFGPESGVSTLQILVEDLDGQRSYVSYDDPSVCGAPSVQLDVVLSFVTGGGALDERFAATLVARDANLVSFAVSRDPSDWAGSLSFGLTANQSITGLVFEGEITPDGHAGVLRAVLEETTEELSSQAELVILTWPASIPPTNASVLP